MAKLSYPPILTQDSAGILSVLGVGRGKLYYWRLVCNNNTPPTTYLGSLTTVDGAGAEQMASQLASAMYNKGATFVKMYDPFSINIGSCSLFVSNTGNANLADMCLVNGFGCTVNPVIKRNTLKKTLNTIRGFVWNDLNKNRVRDSNEAYLRNWRVYLVNSNNVAISKLTDANGYFEFTQLPVGSYKIVGETRGGYIYTTPQTALRYVSTTTLTSPVYYGVFQQ
jgi:hypothetical protein